MRNWTGARIQADALMIDCPYCHAPAGEGCRTKDGPLTAFPAHVSRIRNAQNATQEPHTATNTSTPVRRDRSTPQNGTQEVFPK